MKVKVSESAAMGHTECAGLRAPEGAYKNSACPACEETAGAEIFSETCEGVRIEIRLCARCGLGYSNPRPTEAYKQLRYAEWAKQERPFAVETHYDHRQQLRHFHLYRRVMEEIDRRIGGGHLLDVGCAGGLFLVFAGVFASEHHGGINSRYKVTGAGFDPQEVELAKRISGAPVVRLEELGSVTENSFDAITLLNVLEHVNHPTELLRQLRRVLRPGGVLVVVVPNNELAFWKLRHRVGQKQNSFTANEHINHFRPGSLRRLLNAEGFGRVELRAVPLQSAYGSMTHVPLKHLVKHSAYRVLHACTGAGCYIYSEIFCVAE